MTPADAASPVAQRPVDSRNSTRIVPPPLYRLSKHPGRPPKKFAHPRLRPPVRECRCTRRGLPYRPRTDYMTLLRFASAIKTITLLSAYETHCLGRLERHVERR